MDLIFWKMCDLCKGIFRKSDMKHGIMIGLHYPWSFCHKCNEEFFNEEVKYEEFNRRRSKRIR